MGKRKSLRLALNKAKEYTLEMPQRLALFSSLVELSFNQAFLAESVYPITVRNEDGSEVEVHMTEGAILEEYGEEVLSQVIEAFRSGAEEVVIPTNSREVTTGDWGANDYNPWTHKPSEGFDVEN
jgi:hypothetical protein